MTDNQLLDWLKQAGARIEMRVGSGGENCELVISNWMDTKIHHEMHPMAQLRRFAEIVSQSEREACAQACERHAEEQQVMIVTHINDNPRSVVARECAALIRMRAGEGE